MYTVEIYVISNVMLKHHKGDAYYFIRALKGEQVIKEQGYRESFDITTRNRSYLETVLKALSRMNISKYECSIYCDHVQVVSDAVELFDRAKRKFKKKSGGEYANADLWRKFMNVIAGKKWTWQHMPRSEIEKVAQISEIQ